MVSLCAVLVLAAKPPNQTDWYFSGEGQCEERSRARTTQSLQEQTQSEDWEWWGLKTQAWGLEKALVQVFSAPLIDTGQTQTSPLVPFFGITSGKAAWLEGKDFGEGLRVDADLSHGLRNISLCSLATSNNRNVLLLGKTNCAFQERCTKTLDLKGKGS